MKHAPGDEAATQSTALVHLQQSSETLSIGTRGSLRTSIEFSVSADDREVLDAVVVIIQNITFQGACKVSRNWFHHMND